MTKWQEWKRFSEDEKNWLGSDERGLLKAEYLGEYRLRLWFEEELDVSIYELDFYPLFVEENPGSVFEALKDINRFALVDGEYGLVWLNPDTGAYDEHAIDIAPECIRFFCNRYGTKIKDGSHHYATEVAIA